MENILGFITLAMISVALAIHFLIMLFACYVGIMESKEWSSFSELKENARESFDTDLVWETVIAAMSLPAYIVCTLLKYKWR